LYSSAGTCSAAVISPNNVIVTAAHCLYDTDINLWYDDWVFVPAFKNGAAPFGGFTWLDAVVPTAWAVAGSSSAGARYDVGVIKLAPNSDGLNVTFYTGWLPYAMNGSYVQHAHSFGYPVNIGNANYSIVCEAESFSQSGEIMGMGCPMQFGASGGPWLKTFVPYSTGAMNYVTNVTSHMRTDTAGRAFYAARFNNSNIGVVCNSAGC
jgi:V8-like Glu-specific endopeptidase